MQNLVFTAKQRIQTGRDRNYEEKRKNECDAFMLGFRLGGRFMLEVMENMDIPFIDE